MGFSGAYFFCSARLDRLLEIRYNSFVNFIRPQSAGEVKTILTPPASSVSREGDAYKIVAAPNIELKNYTDEWRTMLGKEET